MDDLKKPLPGPDLEALAQILAAFNGTEPDAMDVVRGQVLAQPEAAMRAVAAMNEWRLSW